ncbi:cytochrome P450 [Hypoxylon sp. FL1150]|nr:cytochrome P450 [Hypoxylon sp. FL1150]
MDSLTEILSWQRTLASIVVYFVTVALYRLYLHPLSRIPGPKLAALTHWYEAYYDVYQNGQYTFKIKNLHEEYGPIIRISPRELHVSDPAFFEHLYRQDGRWDKYAWAVDAFAAHGATLFTPNHDLHKARRQPLSPFFSKAKVASHQEIILEHLEKLCNRLTAFATSQQTVNLGAAITAFSRDVANDFVLRKSYNSLEREDFDEPMVAASAGGGQMWRLSKHVRFIAPLMRAIPVSWIMKLGDDPTKLFFRHIEETMQDTIKLMDVAASPNDEGRRTIVHEILDSKLPPAEKASARVFEDTTASALRLITFHLYTNPDILQRLRDELAGASDTLEWERKVLEQLPYLTAILMEGLRLSPAIGTRMARIAPDRDLSYEKWTIPAGTPVGMTLVLMHSDDSIYPDPHRFSPERWMDPDARRKLDKAFAPFSKGTRNCLGMHLAWAEMYILIATLVQRYDFKYQGAVAEDFLCVSDQFAIGTKSQGVLRATVMQR